MNIHTVDQFAKKHPAFSEGGLRWQIFNADKNGMNKHRVIVRVGRRVYIHEERFFEWVDGKTSDAVEN